MAKYFDKFPLVEYDGKLARNILVNVDFTEQTKKDIYSNFDYVISDNLARPDSLSNINYNSPYYDWLIYLSNNTVDPYHDFYSSEEDLQKFIVKKYGSVQQAEQTILYYRNNWAPDDSEVKVAIYDNLPSSVQKYYKPKINNFNQVVGYERKKEDWIRSTNKIINIKLNFIIDDLKIGDKFVTSTGSGYIIGIDLQTTSITINHIQGTINQNDDISFISQLLLTNDGDNIVTSTNEIMLFSNGIKIITLTTVVNNIPDLEAPFWAPVSAYEFELESNEVKKHINLIKNSYLPDLEKKFQELLK